MSAMSAGANSMLVEFLRYNAWANLRLLEACEQLSPDQLALDAPGTFGSVYRTLEHLIDSESFYLSLVTSVRVPPSFRWEDKPAVAQLREYCAVIGSAMIRAAGDVKPDDVVHQRWRGKIDSYKAVVVLIQVVNHGVEHRTNITSILSAHGLTGFAPDGWGYLSANRDRLGAD